MLKISSFVGRLIGNRLFPLALVLAAGLLPATSGHAMDITVTASNSTVDGVTTSIPDLLTNPGSDLKVSLHEAVTACNNTAGADVIHFDPSLASTIIFCSGIVPTITETLTIDGEEQDITLDCDGASGTAVFTLGSGSSSSAIKSLALINASAGGIRIESTGNTIHQMSIFGNSASGIVIDNQGGSGNNTITACKIGTNGTTDFGNSGNGISIVDSSNNVIGGLNAADRNIISGNTGAGVSIQISGSVNLSSGNRILNNTIGMSADGHTEMGNDSHGVYLLGTAGPAGHLDSTLIGDVVEGPGGNLISGNGGSNIYMSGAAITNTKIQGNIVGLDLEGDDAISVDASHGIMIENGVSTTLIGGTLETTRNISSGNNANGITIQDCSDNSIQGNYIGTAANGTTNVGNVGEGIVIFASGLGSTGNVIGGAQDAGNVIAFNGLNGVLLSRATANVEQTTITYNSIHSNTGDGIKFSLSSVNGNMVPPGISAINATAPYSVSVVGAQVGEAVHLYADSDDEGMKFLEKVIIAVAGGPTVIPVNLAPLDGKNITATRTDANGNTSEFSVVTSPNPVPQIAPSLVLDDRRHRQ